MLKSRQMLLAAGCLLYHGRAAAELLANELGPDDPEHLLSAKHEHLREIGGAHDVPCGTDGLQTCNLEVSNLTEVEQLLGNTQGRMRSQRCTSDKLYYMHIGESRKIQCKSDHGVAIYALSTSTKLVQIEMAITQPPPPPQDSYLTPIENSLEFLSLTNFSYGSCISNLTAYGLNRHC
ncbi:hypothetical protein Ac2012v2_006181 [Leucoagaricus gongylophorus]